MTPRRIRNWYLAEDIEDAYDDLERALSRFEDGYTDRPLHRRVRAAARILERVLIGWGVAGPDWRGRARKANRRT